MAGSFYFGWIKINFVILLTFRGLLHSVVTPDTPVESFNWIEMLSSVHSSVEAKEPSPAPWVSFTLSVSESMTKVFCLFVGLIFTSSESELYSEELSSSETLVYMLLEQSEKAYIKLTKKFFTQKFCDESLLKILCL